MGFVVRAAGHHFLRKRSSRTTSAPPLSAGLSRGGSGRSVGCGGRPEAGSPERWSCRRPPLAGFRRLVPSRLARLGLVGVLVRRLRERLELQRELHGRVGESLDRLERHDQPLSHAAERQADLERLVGHLEVPELMLQDDRHLLRILRAQPVRQPDALGGGVEGDEEMMLAGHALVLAGFGQHVADHAAQRLLDQNVVADVIDGHEALRRLPDDDANAATAKWHPRRQSRPNIGDAEVGRKVEASVARCLRTPPDGA